MNVRILVLEDDPEMRELLGVALEDEGYEVALAARGLEALELVRSQPFDLLVADVRMEGMSGLDVIEQVQAEQPLVGSLVVTGYTSEADSMRAVQLKVGGYIKKPLNLTDFLANVGQLVAARKAELQRLEQERTLRHSALWAARSMAQMLNLKEAGDKAARAARWLGLSEAEAEEAELATLFELLPNAPKQPENKIVACARARHENPEATAYELAQEHGLDPVVLQAYEQSHDKEQKDTRGLLQLASTLEAAGDAKSAAHAYQEALDIKPEGREAVAASLGLARIARKTADVTATRDHLKRAIDAARALGPETAAQTELHAGLELLTAGDPAAANLLANARKLTKLPAQEAQAHLALLTLQPPDEAALREPLNTLLKAENRAEWAGSAPWLLPFLTRHHLADKAVQRACLELTGQVLQNLPKLNAESLLEAVKGLNDNRLVPILQRLGAEHPQAQKLLAHLGAPTSLPALRIVSLGGFEVYRGEERVDESEWKTKKVKYLLAYLAAHGNRFVGEDQVVDLFWPDDAEKGRKNLYSATSILRKVLRPSYWQGDLDLVLRSQQRLQLHPDAPFWHDLTTVEALLQEIPRLDAEQALERARKIAQLYKGPYLEGCYMDWALAIRTRLEQEVAGVLHRLAQHVWSQGRYHEVLEFSKRVLEIDSCHQDSHLLLVQYYLAVNRPEEAVRQFESCKRILKNEMGMEPSIELLTAHQRALLSLSAV